MRETARPKLLILFELHEDDRARFAGRFDILYHPQAGVDLIRQLGEGVEAVLTVGAVGLSRAAMAALPNLRIILNLGAGHEKVDLEAARDLGIAVTYGGGLNADTVADHVLGLMLGVIRQIPLGDARLRQGDWDRSRRRPGSLCGKTVGIFGLGAVGEAIARRLQGFGCRVLYTNRRPKAGVSYGYVAELVDLARHSDVLVLTCPGGPETRYAVDAEVLAALGPKGYLVNASRGSVVQTEALVAALEAGGIAGAALDVFETEPEVPAALLPLETVVLSSHVGGLSDAALAATAGRAIRNFFAYRDGQELEGALVDPRIG